MKSFTCSPDSTPDCHQILAWSQGSLSKVSWGQERLPGHIGYFCTPLSSIKETWGKHTIWTQGNRSISSPVIVKTETCVCPTLIQGPGQGTFLVSLSRSGWVVFPFLFPWDYLSHPVWSAETIPWEQLWMRITVTAFVWQQRDFREPVHLAWRWAQSSFTLEQLNLSQKNICLHRLFGIWMGSGRIQLVAAKCDSVYSN